MVYRLFKDRVPLRFEARGAGFWKVETPAVEARSAGLEKIETGGLQKNSKY